MHYQYILENASMLTTPFGAVKFPWIKKNYGGSSNALMRTYVKRLLTFSCFKAGVGRLTPSSSSGTLNTSNYIGALLIAKNLQDGFASKSSSLTGTAMSSSSS